MTDINKFLENLSKITDIGFSVTDKNGQNLFISDNFNLNSEIVFISISLGKTTYLLNTNKSNKEALKLLKYTIENEYSKLYTSKEQYVIDILEGKERPLDLYSEGIPYLPKGCNILLINVDKNLNKALDIINEVYITEEVTSVHYKDNILVIGIFENVEEHAIEIKEALTLDLACKCNISISDIIYNEDQLEKAFYNCKLALLLGNKFKLKSNLLTLDKLFLENLVYSTDKSLKQDYINRYKNAFDNFDIELLNTIEQCLQCDLNLSHTAKKLFIHRNTLIYRLDKIKKETGFDIKNFNQAMLFSIIFLIWKETN